jgi:ketosteroid isomerase-like protein
MHEVVQRYVAAMQRGPDGLDALLDLFTDDAVYVEPFSTDGVHVGREAIGSWLGDSADQAPPQLTLTVERLDVDGDTVDTTWRCESPIFARPSRGRDRFTIRYGRISRLETTLLEPPELR